MDILAPLKKLAHVVLASLDPTNPTVSFGRFMSLMITVVCMTWDTSYVVFAMRHYGSQPILTLLPDPGTLASQGVFMLLFYGATKATEFASK